MGDRRRGWRRRGQWSVHHPSPHALGSSRATRQHCPGAGSWLSTSAQDSPSSLPSFPSTSPWPPLGLSSHPPARLHFSGFELILSTPLSAGCQLSIPCPPPPRLLLRGNAGCSCGRDRQQQGVPVLSVQPLSLVWLMLCEPQHQIQQHQELGCGEIQGRAPAEQPEPDQHQGESSNATVTNGLGRH